MKSATTSHSTSTIELSINRFSLTQKLIVAGAFLSLMICLTNLFQFNSAIETLKKDLSEQVEYLAVNIGNSIAAQFYERYGDAQAFSVNPIFQTANKNEMVQTLDTYVNLYGIYDLIIFVNREGKVVAVNHKGPDGKPIQTDKIYDLNFSKTKWFIDTMEGHFLEDKERQMGGTVFVEPKFDSLVQEAYGKKSFNAIFAAPVKNAAGEIIGAICNRSNFKWVDNEILTSYRKLKMRGFESTEFQVINKEGFTISDFDPSSETKEEFIWDENVLNKENYLKMNYEPANLIRTKGEGHLVAEDPRHHDLQLAGYAKINSSKFPVDLGWGVFVRIPVSDLYATANKATQQYWIFGSIVALFGLIFAILFARHLGRSFEAVSDKVATSTEATKILILRLNDAANQLSAAAHEQVAAIQESVSALSEMESMINVTGQNVKHSVATTAEALHKSSEGQEIMENMVSSMNSIQAANHELQELSKVIENINTKTTVINDIVFKTQLLSFNASIEAARAGQHGRGFAVVAEEVGNLADMSGQAAREIETLLEESKRKVSDTLQVIHSRVLESHKVSNSAQIAFQEISKKMDDISKQVKAIGEATNQQEIGIQQSSSAMKELDSAAISNNKVSLEAQEIAHRLEQGAKDLTSVLQSMLRLIRGSKNKNPHLNTSLADGLSQNKIEKQTSSGSGSASSGSTATSYATQSMGERQNHHEKTNSDDELSADSDLFKKVS